jgi:hypothetical protein
VRSAVCFADGPGAYLLVVSEETELGEPRVVDSKELHQQAALHRQIAGELESRAAHVIDMALDSAATLETGESNSVKQLDPITFLQDRDDSRTSQPAATSGEMEMGAL